MKKALRLFLFGVISFIVVFAIFLALNWKKLTDQLPNFLLIEPTFRVHLCEGTTPKSPKILFVGNSLTFINMLPWLVANFSMKLRNDRPDVYQLLRPGANLDDHYNLGHFEKIVSNQKFDYVVIQEQTGRALDESEAVAYWLKAMSDIAKRNGAKVIVFEPWVDRRYSDEQSRIHQNFAVANKDLKLQIAPVGDAFFDPATNQTNLKVYAEDEHHASNFGSYLATCILYETIFNSSCVGAPTAVSVKGAYGLDVQLVNLTDDQAKTLQQVAHDIVSKAKPKQPDTFKSSEAAKAIPSSNSAQ